MKKWFTASLLTLFVLASVFGSSPVTAAGGGSGSQGADQDTDTPKNVIYLIGDGMGVTYNTAYRYYKNGGFSEDMVDTEFDHHLVGQQKTHPHDEEENITDSAASATAMATGSKTYNNAIAVDHELNELETALEVAKASGKSTGLVATSEITHATPASFGAHDESRHNHADIADDYFDERINDQMKVDVLLGGGIEYFEREDRNLIEEFQNEGYDFVDSAQEMQQSQNSQLLGLFSEGGLPKKWDRTEEIPSLESMTQTALDTLGQNDEGFFLMVEGSQIDWAGHANDIAGAMSEMEDFEAAFAAAIDFAEEDGETLVVTTADHNTGGFSLGLDGEYNWNAEPLHEMHRTPEFITEEILETEDIHGTLDAYIDWAFTSEEIGALEEALLLPTADRYGEIEGIIKEAVDKRTFTGWTTSGHTGEDVNVYAYGPGKDNFQGLTDNIEHGDLIKSFMAQ
ncbi:alkaline phosphatase [Salinicoccus bachuensis]|uniref:Alkaline phosphatase n=1 Tax=Salinicoccus bachuensis TaxID=3136731 RepID=A0ABZ3CJH6_9STAP